MNHFDLLKRALHITWRYKPLWLFGFIFALCGGSGSGGGGGGNLPGSSGGGNSDGNGFDNLPGMPDIDPGTLIAVIAAVIVLILLLAVVGAVLRYIAQTALIKMVRQVTETEAISVADGWRLGRSAEAWRLFLINLIIGIPLTVVSIILLALAFAPLLLLITESPVPMAIGVILTVVSVILVALLLIVVNAVISPWRELAWREAALAHKGVFDSLRSAFDRIKQRLKDVAVVWLLMFGVGIGWGIVSLFTVLPLSLFAALVVGGIPAALVYFIAGSWLGAAITGIPLAILALVIVGSFASGLYLAYHSTVWTLTFLEIQPDNAAESAALPSPPIDLATDDA